MLEISCRNGSHSDPLVGPKVISRGCQTDERPCSPLNTAATRNIQPNEKSIITNGSYAIKPEESCSELSDSNMNNGLSGFRQQKVISSTKDNSSGNANGSTSAQGNITLTIVERLVRERLNSCAFWYGF